ncbi:serine hydrolase domain-containing protein [Lacrimispora sphenoides]|uniref:CubicO group peptidase, beta-lactamase class C family n=1 Tax=Lacrimispora sphenoides JCM 1415 TaxID=1297793 RepID=A0ABY1CE74_9FIRM|nr:serine hydrolase [Lacrimispora sphenoides]SET96436.1 CubicO group peptidase, beta-lactamase class C family [[Clostridium] sphenoides JCM 1415]SUY52779.1 beta-lactamase [Lacrimispora sphenoides]
MNQEKMKEIEKTINSDYSNIAGILVQKNGIKLYENYFNGYTADNAVHVFSVTKSVFSALIGIAIDKGLIKSADQKVLDFFPDYAVKASEKTIQGITLKNLLTMTAPYKYKSEPYEEFFASDNWVNSALDLLGGEKHTGEFMYSPIIGTHILSGILVKATGQPVLDFAAEHLFSPLGIKVTHNVVLRNKEEHIAVMNDKNTSGWVVDPQGINTASWGLFLTPEDMAKIGQLYLNGGKWENKQIISEKWIEESTKEHIRLDRLSYGYLWWIFDNKEPVYAALGDGGNVIYINTKKKMVVSIASLFMPDAKDRIGLIMECIEPIFED